MFRFCWFTWNGCWNKLPEICVPLYFQVVLFVACNKVKFLESLCMSVSRFQLTSAVFSSTLVLFFSSTLLTLLLLYSSTPPLLHSSTPPLHHSSIPLVLLQTRLFIIELAIAPGQTNSSLDHRDKIP